MKDASGRRGVGGGSQGLDSKHRRKGEVCLIVYYSVTYSGLTDIYMMKLEQANE